MTKVLTDFLIYFFCLAALTTACLAGVETASGVAITPKETPQQRAERMKWFREARFGMFIHWGPSAVLGGEYKGREVPFCAEWIQHTARIPYREYEQVSASFNPTKFDAKTVVRTAKDAGMKYIVITSKHHDGFCMWDSKLTDYNIVKWTKFKRDVIRELADECHKQGIKFGIYYSVRDWHHPDWLLRYTDLGQTYQYNSRWGFAPSKWTNNNHYACGCPSCSGGISTLSKDFDPRPTETADMNRYLDYMKGQLIELMSNYKDVSVMWFDAQDITDNKLGRIEEMISTMRRVNPKVIINDRIANEGMLGDYGVHECQIPGTGDAREWETCMTLNGSWGYNKYDHAWKSAGEIVRMLVDTTSKNGNLLLNIGPDGEGIIPQPSVDNLKETGKWMSVNGESIYGCGASGLPAQNWGTSTAKPGHIYLHIFDWPKDGALNVPLTGKIKKAYLLPDRKKPLKYESTDSGVRISLSSEGPDKIDSVVALELESRR